MTQQISAEELSDTRNFVREWERRNKEGKLSAGWLVTQGDAIDTLVKIFKEVANNELPQRIENARGVQYGNGNSQVNTF